MPASTSIKRGFPLPGATIIDKRVTDIQAIKSALVAIDNSMRTDVTITGTFSGKLKAFVGNAKYYPPKDGVIKYVYFSLGNASQTGDVIIDVKKNGSSIFGSSKPQVSSGLFKSEKYYCDVPVTSEDYITVDIVQSDDIASDAVVFINID